MKKKKWLIVHNRYKNKTGEEIFVEKFKNLLLSQGNEVIELNIFKTYSLINKLRFLVTQNLNLYFPVRLSYLIYTKKIDVVNLHNPYPYISHIIILLKHLFPKTKFIHTLHNYRNFCSNGLLYDGEKICHDCFANSFSGFKKNCNGNKIISLAFSIRLYVDNLFGLKWKYDHFLVLNNYQKSLLIENVETHKIIVFPNFDDFNKKQEKNTKSINFIFIGRIYDNQKGFEQFLRLAKIFQEYSFIAVGDYGTSPPIKLENLKYTGFISKEKVEFYLSKSKYLICTSKSYEGFPNIILEAWKNQTIPIVPDYPTYNSIVRENGIIYKNYEDLILKMKNIESMEIKLNFKELNDLYSKRSALELLRKNNLLEISS